MGRKTLWLIATLFVATTSVVVAYARIETVGDWTRNYTNTTVEYVTRNGASDSLELVCGFQGGYRVNLGHFIINGNGPPEPYESIDVVVDGKTFDIALGKDSHIRTGCAGCAQNFNGMWHALRTGKSLRLRFDDGRKALFSLRGSAKIMHREPCHQDFRSLPENPSAEPQNTAWRVTKEISKIDDSQNVRVSVNAREPHTNRYGKSDYLSVHITCRENKTDLYIYFAGEFMAGRDDMVLVTYRVDDNKAESTYFKESNDNEALGIWEEIYPHAIPFIRKLLGAQNLLIRATPYSESAVTAEFNITGLHQAIMPLRKACGW